MTSDDTSKIIYEFSDKIADAMNDSILPMPTLERTNTVFDIINIRQLNDADLENLQQKKQNADLENLQHIINFEDSEVRYNSSLIPKLSLPEHNLYTEPFINLKHCSLPTQFVDSKLFDDDIKFELTGDDKNSISILVDTSASIRDNEIYFRDAINNFKNTFKKNFNKKDWPKINYEIIFFSDKYQNNKKFKGTLDNIPDVYIYDIHADGMTAIWHSAIQAINDIEIDRRLWLVIITDGCNTSNLKKIDNGNLYWPKNENKNIKNEDLKKELEKEGIKVNITIAHIETRASDAAKLEESKKKINFNLINIKNYIDTPRSLENIGRQLSREVSTPSLK